MSPEFSQAMLAELLFHLIRIQMDCKTTTVSVEPHDVAKTFQNIIRKFTSFYIAILSDTAVRLFRLDSSMPLSTMQSAT